MSGDVWYPVGPRDVFPEEFATFLLTDPEVRAAFLATIADLLDARWWQTRQEALRNGDLAEVLSYPARVRFAPASRERSRGGAWRSPCSCSAPAGAALASLLLRSASAQRIAARALALRDEAVRRGDQPYGAVVVKDGAIVGEGVSAVVTARDPDAHAERVALRDAQPRLGTAGLAGCLLFGSSRACVAVRSRAYRAGIARMYFGRDASDGGAPKSTYACKPQRDRVDAARRSHACRLSDDAWRGNPVASHTCVHNNSVMTRAATFSRRPRPCIANASEASRGFACT